MVFVGGSTRATLGNPEPWFGRVRPGQAPPGRTRPPWLGGGPFNRRRAEKISIATMAEASTTREAGSTSRARNWFVVDNHGTLEKWHDEIAPMPALRYIVYQQERAPTTGQLHIQAFVSFSSRKTFQQVKTLIKDNPHLELVKNVRASIDYSRKQESRVQVRLSLSSLTLDRASSILKFLLRQGPFERGDEAAVVGDRGKRTDLDGVKDALDAGATPRDISESHFATWVKYHRAFDRFHQARMPVRSDPPHVRVFWGPTGTGKTRRAWDEAGPEAFLVSTDKAYRFSNYEGQTRIIWDEFAGNECDIKYLLALLDRYPFKVRGLYCEVPFAGTDIWITSNIDPANWYPNANPAHQAALRRRLVEFGTVVHMTGTEVAGNTSVPPPPHDPLDGAHGPGLSAQVVAAANRLIERERQLALEARVQELQALADAPTQDDSASVDEAIVIEEEPEEIIEFDIDGNVM